MKKLPKQVIIYICDYVDEQPVYAAVTSVDEIPEDEHGSTVGVYKLDKASTFTVHKEI